jgi:trimeric autotransporter adhesin
VQVSYAARLASTPQLSLVQTQAGREPLGFLDCFRGWSSAAAAGATTAAGATAAVDATAEAASKPTAAQFEALDFAALGTEDSDEEADGTVTTLHDTAAVAAALTVPAAPPAVAAAVVQQQPQQQAPAAARRPHLPPAAAGGRASLAPPATTTSTTAGTTAARSRNVSFGPDGRPDSDACFSLGVDLVSGLDSVDFNAALNSMVGSPLTSEGGYSTRSNSPPRSPLSDCGSDGGSKRRSTGATSKHAQQAAAQKRQSGAESARRRQQARQARQSLGSSGHSAGSGKRYSSTAAGRRISSFFRSVCRVSLAPAAADDDNSAATARSPRVSLAPLSRTGSWVSVSAGVESDVRAAAAVRQQQQQQGQFLSRSAHARLPPRSSTSSRAKRGGGGDPFAAADEEHAASAAAAVLDPTVKPTPLRHSAPPKPSGVAAASGTGAAAAGEATAAATATKRDRVSNLLSVCMASVSITIVASVLTLLQRFQLQYNEQQCC